MRPNGMENLAAFGAREVKRAATEEREERGVFLCCRTVKVEVKGKVIPTSFLKIEGRGAFIGTEECKKRDS